MLFDGVDRLTVRHMKRVAIIIALCAAGACIGSRLSPSPARTPNAAPVVDTARRVQAAVNLTGSWATGTGLEPAARQVVMQPQCNYSPAMWILEQSGDTVRAWMIAESYAKGVAEPRSASRAATEGRVSGLDLTLGSGGSRYLLHYDSTSGHLRGTLNGAPFWAIRLEVVQPQGCIPVP